MKLTPVNQIPKKRAARHNLQDLIEEFVNGGYIAVLVEFNENDYKSAKSCSSCLHTAIKRSGYSIQVCQRGNSVFLIKNKDRTVPDFLAKKFQVSDETVREMAELKNAFGCHSK